MEYVYQQLVIFLQVLTDLSMSNCTMGDFAAANLACALENNKTLEKLSIESNNVSPQTLVKIFEVRMNAEIRLQK